MALTKSQKKCAHILDCSACEMYFLDSHTLRDFHKALYSRQVWKANQPCLKILLFNPDVCFTCFPGWARVLADVGRRLIQKILSHPEYFSVSFGNLSLYLCPIVWELFPLTQPPMINKSTRTRPFWKCSILLRRCDTSKFKRLRHLHNVWLVTL